MKDQNKNDSILYDLMKQYGNWFNDQKQLDKAKMSNSLYPYTSMFSPIQINSISSKNRLVMGPMGNINMAEENGRPSGKMVQYFTERAKGGVGIITSGLVHVSQGLDPTVTEMKGHLSYFPRIGGTRIFWAGWRDIAENCHAYGTRFFIQLSAGMGRVGSPECIVNELKFPISASMNPNFYIPGLPCLPASNGKLKKIIANFGQYAVDAKMQNIDGVYLHGHEGYLLEQMTNPAYNRRKMGRFANWQQFGIDIVKEIRKRCGNNYPIWYRIDLSLALNATYGEKMDKVSSLKKFKNERTIEQTLEYMENLVKAGVDMFDVDLGCYDNFWLPHPPIYMPPGCYLDISKIVKDYFKAKNIKSNAGLDVPIIAVGKLGYPDLAENAIRSGQCDMIMLARPLLADPQWPTKAYLGKCSEICPCIGDQEACFNEFIEGGHPQCAVNPRTGNEDLIPAELIKTDKPKRVAVIGAGAAGVMCAVIAAKRGHNVELFDANSKPGGVIIAGSASSCKIDLRNYLDYLANQINGAVKENGLKANFNTKVTLDLLKKGNYEAIVFALGGIPKTLKIPGIEQSHVIQAIDLYKKPELAKNAKNVVVIGGGSVGCEAAHMLAYEMNKTVKLVEILPNLMPRTMSASRFYLIHYLEKAGVEILNCTTPLEITSNSVKVQQNISSTVPDPYISWTPVVPENIHNPFGKAIKLEPKERDLDADLVVIAAGLNPNSDLYEQALKAALPAKLYNIGDSFATGRIFEATKAGFHVGRSL